MCGIFGIITSKNSSYSEEFLTKSLRKLAILSETRGKDSSGLCAFNQDKGRIEVAKGPVSIKLLFKQKNRLFIKIFIIKNFNLYTTSPISRRNFYK